VGGLYEGVTIEVVKVLVIGKVEVAVSGNWETCVIQLVPITPKLIMVAVISRLLEEVKRQ